MATLSESYSTAMKNFTALTSKAAPALKTKGKEEGLKKLLMVMKSGKTVEQRLADYEGVEKSIEAVRDNNLKALPGLLKDLKTAQTKLDEGLKKTIEAYEEQGKQLGPADGSLKAGFDILGQRLDGLRKHAKTQLLVRVGNAEKRLGTLVSGQEALNRDLAKVQLGVKKGAAEFEAALKQFLAKPTEQNLKDALCSSVQARSIGVAVTHWKNTVLKASPGIGDKLRADPVHLLTHINDPQQNRSWDFWHGKFKIDQGGWEDRAKPQVKKYLDQMKNWRTMADEIKALIQ